MARKSPNDGKKRRAYTYNLKSPMKVGDDLTVEVPKRLIAICKLYGIDQSDSLWERRLLMALLEHHVPGFALKSPPLYKNDDAFIVDIINQALDHYEEANGVRPSVDSVVTELKEDLSQEPIAGKNHGRLLRIYSSRTLPYKNEGVGTVKPNNSVTALWGRMMSSSKALSAAPRDSHAVLLREAYRRRNLKPLLSADK